MLGLFRRSGRKLQEQVYQPAHESDQLSGDVTKSLQQVEEEYARIRLQRMLRGIHEAADCAIRVGLPTPVAIAKGLRDVTAPLPPRKAGSLARAKTAWRYLDGTFMPESEKLEAYRRAYEQHAAGGLARAASAIRASYGKFAGGQTDTSYGLALK